MPAVLEEARNMTASASSALLTLEDGEVAATRAPGVTRQLNLHPAQLGGKARMEWPIGWMSLSALSVAALLVFH
jgi:hypothetical protein